MIPTLYKRNSNGKLQQWEIVVVPGGYVTTEGLVGGKLTTSSLHAVEPKNPGKRNATSVEQQAEKEALAKWKKKTETGYTTNISAVDEVTFKKPMKGEKFSDYSDEVVYPVYYQDKLNGVRCQNDRAGAWSTGGKLFHTIPHVRRALAPIFLEHPDAFIDGEAYNHALRRRLNRLIELVSVVYQPKDITPEMLVEAEAIVKFHIFDAWGFNGITQDTPWVERVEAAGQLIKSLETSVLQVEPYFVAKNIRELLAAKKRNKLEKGEGLMVRWGTCVYKHGRSKYMLKLKHFEDAEFTIVDVQEGNGDWKGCAKRIILALHAPTPDGETTFASNIDGDRGYLRDLYNRRAEVIGQLATVEYQQLSEYGVPQIPFVRAIRNYE